MNRMVLQCKLCHFQVIKDSRELEDMQKKFCEHLLNAHFTDLIESYNEEDGEKYGPS